MTKVYNQLQRHYVLQSLQPLSSVQDVPLVLVLVEKWVVNVVDGQFGQIHRSEIKLMLPCSVLSLSKSTYPCKCSRLARFSSLRRSLSYFMYIDLKSTNATKHVQFFFFWGAGNTKKNMFSFYLKLFEICISPPKKVFKKSFYLKF